MVLEQNFYSEAEASPFAEFLEDRKGDKFKTPEIRMKCTAAGAFKKTEKVEEVLEELERASYVMRVGHCIENTWKVSSYTEEEEVLNYLTDSTAYDRKPHPLGPEFNIEEIKGSFTMGQLFSNKDEYF